MKKAYFLRILAVSALLAAVIIASFFSVILSIGEESIRNGNFVFTVFYSLALTGLIFLANTKKLKTLQGFLTVYLGGTFLLFLLMLIMEIFPSIKLHPAISFAFMFEVFPFCGWYHVIESNIVFPLFCSLQTGAMTAAVAIPFIRGLKK